MIEPITLHEPGDLTLEVLEQVAWQGRPLRLAPALLDRLSASRTQLLAALDTGQSVYGVTTGMGYLSGVALSEEEQRAHQANLLLGRAVGGPPFLERAEARALLLTRLGSFLTGHAGVTPELCLFLAARLNDDFVPAIPRTGIGCAGEIIPLAHAFQTFIGVGQVLLPTGELQPATVALAARGVTPYVPLIKEGIALLAGAPGVLSLAVSRYRSGTVLLRQLVVAWACAVDAMRAPLSPYDPVLAQLANDPRMASLLSHLGTLLDGSDLDRHEGQAPVSFRVIPQVLAYLSRTLDRLEDEIRRGLRAVTDSPVFVAGRFITSGGFHAIGLTADLDALAVALNHAAELAGQHIHRLLDRRFSGLPDQLTPQPGPHAGLVAVHKRVIGTLAESRRLAMPATVGMTDSSMGQEDAMTFGFDAAEKLRRVEDLLREVIAAELLVCRQAWSLRATPPADGLKPYVQAITNVVSAVDRDRLLGPDISALTALLQAGDLT